MDKKKKDEKWIRIVFLGRTRGDDDDDEEWLFVVWHKGIYDIMLRSVTQNAAQESFLKKLF